MSPDAQLSLLERLVHHVRVELAGSPGAWETELSAMAADPEVQRELACINAEFSATEGATASACIDRANESSLLAQSRGLS